MHDYILLILEGDYRRWERWEDDKQGFGANYRKISKKNDLKKILRDLGLYLKEPKNSP